MAKLDDAKKFILKGSSTPNIGKDDPGAKNTGARC